MPRPRSSWRTRLSLRLSHATELHALRPRSVRTCRSSSARGRNSEPVTGPTSRRSTLPTDYVVSLLCPRGASKDSTAAVYRQFDERDGAAGFEERRAGLLRRARAREGRAGPRDAPRERSRIAPLRQELEAHGAFRADVTGAGPVVYGLFDDRKRQRSKPRRRLRDAGRTWLVRPVRRANGKMSRLWGVAKW